MDGLMLDTERVARIACQEAARLGGHEMSDLLFQSLIGRTSRDSTEILQTAFGPAFDAGKYNRECNRVFEEYVMKHSVPLKEGVHEILADLSARKIPLGVATSTRNPNARRRLEQTGLMTYFSVLVSGDEIARGKPEPDIYLEAIRRLDIDPATSFALEDSPPGVRSAKAAGLKVIMVPDLVTPTPEIEALAEHVARSLHEAQRFLQG
jgi:HAD superfamily hydrolase (TIGR01509 family)